MLIAVVIGFAGAALILKPGTAFFQPAALVGLAAGVLGGLATVAVWRMPKQESAVRVAVYFALIGIVITAVPVLVEPRLPPVETLPALAMLGAHVLLAGGCLLAPADRVGALQYTSVLFAAGFAWLAWDERVDWFMAAGILLIIAASAIAVRAGHRATGSDRRTGSFHATLRGFWRPSPLPDVVSAASCHAGQDNVGTEDTEDVAIDFREVAHLYAVPDIGAG